MEFWITQTFNGVSYGALLFLLAGGLSLIFGMMRIVNMTHGSYYLLGGYVGLTVIWKTGNFFLAILASALVIAIVGLGEWNAFLKRLSGQELGQVLTTMGFALIFQDLGLVGADRVMVGSDYCFDMGYERPVQIVTGLRGLRAQDRTKILGGNASRLLRLE